MKKNILAILALAAVLSAGCNKAEGPDMEGSRIVSISASVGDVTRVGTGSVLGKFAWETGDAIGIWTGAEFTRFTIEESSVGQSAGTFTGTLPEGGSISENSYAVYPYAEGLSLEGSVISVSDLMGNIPLAAKPVAQSGAGAVTSYKFGLTTALFRLTLKNIPAEANFVFIESTSKIFAVDGTVDMGAEYPKLTSGGADWQFIALPEHSGAISEYELYVPIVPGEWADPMFRFTLFTADDWGSEMAKDPYNHRCNVVSGGYINRGDLFDLPTVTF
ncbi:MAG: fimbrillin family protein [Bacteroidales bacterium]|nr:fimbrillin family protein [Bacteroidales bacterium]